MSGSLMSHNFMFWGSTYFCVLSPMCHRFIVYLQLVYLPLSLISVPSLVYLGPVYFFLLTAALERRVKFSNGL